MNPTSLFAYLFAIAITSASALPTFLDDNIHKRSFVPYAKKETQNVTGILNTGGAETNVTSNSSIIVNPNSLNTTNITLYELNNVSSWANSTQVATNLTSLVITCAHSSLESTGFYFGLAYPNETVVISENTTLGLAVSKAWETWGRGTVVVDQWGYIYSAISYPSCPIGYVSWKSLKVTYYYEASLVSILTPSSPLYSWKNHTAFNTSTVTSNISSTVPIYYFNGSKSSNSSSSSIPGLNNLVYSVVVVGVENTTIANEFKMSSNTSMNPIVVFASNNGTGFIDQEELTVGGALGAGYLSPEKVSVLLSFALAAGLNTWEQLWSILP